MVRRILRLEVELTMVRRWMQDFESLFVYPSSRSNHRIKQPCLLQERLAEFKCGGGIASKHKDVDGVTYLVSIHDVIGILVVPWIPDGLGNVVLDVGAGQWRL